MKITFLGAVRSVTGSMHLLDINGGRILLDCGLFQGRREETYRRNRNLPFDASAVDVMVLSHAHIDHSGNIPNLVRSGFRGPIHSTLATRDLCQIMLRDSAHIMEADIQYVNRKRERQGLAPMEPLYTLADATNSLKHFSSLDYGRPLTIFPGVTLTFGDAGHILGAALTVLDITENGRTFRLLFTGDLGRPGMAILRDPDVISDVDYLITESTYGARYHGPVAETEWELKRIVSETHARKGKLIIPAFSVGRTQEIVYTLHRLSLAGEIPRLPIFVDSPLSIDATDVFRRHPECFDAETHDFMLNHPDPFGFRQLRYVRDVEESKALNVRHEPMVIISASGMCESGRILHHLKNNIGDERNTILFVGYQAENTLGRRILERQERVPIFGEMYALKAHVERIEGYSAHADRHDLVEYEQALDPSRLRKVFIVHGEEEASLSLEEAMRALGVRETVVPHLGEQVTL